MDANQSLPQPEPIPVPTPILASTLASTCMTTITLTPTSSASAIPCTPLEVTELMPEAQLEEAEDVDEDVEDVEGEEEEEELEDEGLLEGSLDRRSKGGVTGRGVTLQMLLGEGILQPGEGAMTIDYLGQKFTGDLMANGKIKSQETNQIFGSPSAWAIYCKKIVNPDKKSGCGWASVKYKGKKLDAYKTSWFKIKRQNQNKENEGVTEGVIESQQKTCNLTGSEEETDSDKEPPAKKEAPCRRIVVKHNILGNRSANHDANTLVESLPFSSMGKIQPFTVSLTSSAMLVMDLHSHLTHSEVAGYLAGHWDVNAHNLAVTQAFPCLCRLGDTTSAFGVEQGICKVLEGRRLTLVGWYHSHPQAAATPTLRDIDAQMEYQIKMKGSSDASYTPCVGVICSPYDMESENLESSITSYWVMPPPESRPQEYGRPMLMTYSVVRDQYLSQEALEEMRHCASFYRQQPDSINFHSLYNDRTSYWEKLKVAATRHCPRELRREQLISYLRDLLHLPSKNEGQKRPQVIQASESNAPKESSEGVSCG